MTNLPQTVRNGVTQKKVVPRPAKDSPVTILSDLNHLDLDADLEEAKTTTPTRTTMMTEETTTETANLHVVRLAVSVFYQAWTVFPNGGLADPSHLFSHKNFNSLLETLLLPFPPFSFPPKLYGVRVILTQLIGFASRQPLREVPR